MAFTFAIVDPADLTTVLFNLATDTGSGNPATAKANFGLGGRFAVSSPDVELVHFSPESRPGGSTVFERDPLVAMSWSQRIYGTTNYDGLSEAVGRLATLLRLGGVIKWQPNGAADPRYIDFEPSPAPALLNGRETELLNVVTRFDTPKGVELLIWRQPYLRQQVLDSLNNILTNATLLGDFALNGTPDGWTWDSTANITNQNIDTLAEAFEFDIATAAERGLRLTTGAASAAPGDVWTLSYYAKQAGADSNCKARVRIEYIDSGVTVLATHNGTLTSLTSAWQRLSVTTAAAPASTDKMRVSLIMDSDTATSFTVQWRFAQLEEANQASPFRSGAEDVANDPSTFFGRAVPVYVQGEAWAPMTVRVRGDSGAKLRDIRVAALSNDSITGRRSVLDYLNSVRYAQCDPASDNGWTRTFPSGSDTTQVADAAASGGNMAQTTHATNPTIMAKRILLTRSTRLNAMRGTWDVFVRCKATASSQHVVQLRWAPSSADPAPYSGAEITIEKTDFTAFQYEDVYLGRIHIPEATMPALTAVTMELWSRRNSGSGNLNWDFLSFVPVNDRLAQIYVPGSSSESWLGKDLESPPYKLTADPTWLTGADSGDHIILNAVNEAAGTPPNAGLAWAVGRHRVSFKFTTPGAGSAFVGTMKSRIVNVTGGGGAGSEVVSDQQVITSELFPVVDTILEFDAAASQVYQAQVNITARTAGQIKVAQIIHEFIPAISSNENAYSDPETLRLVKTDGTQNVLQDLKVRGAMPIMLPPGLSILWLDFADVPQALHTLGESVLGRTPRVFTSHSPRYFG